jgi:carbonic anhydrase/acetyltransferase-like protein (isoleucine patch superfamily)
MIASFRGITPAIDLSAYVTANAVVIGDVTIGAESSVWFNTVIRGDVHSIRIGMRTNVQDHVTVHVFGGRSPTVIGDEVTIGHRAVVHGCTIGNRSLIGIGAIVLDGANVGDDCLIGAGAVVTPRTIIPAGQLVVGSPAKVVRALTSEERAELSSSAQRYAGYAAEYRAAGIT